ncbi:MAG: SCO family protein [Gemmatimonadota bacterium]|nr:MAG: SCO family protein [Gemmatimonadota bacterium]
MSYLRAATTSVCILAASACLSASDRETASGYRGRIFPDPRPKIDFTLKDTEGADFGFRQETDGFVTLLFFGYTHCPDVCPIHMANIGAVLNGFPFELRRQFKVVFVSTDPERDTPERMRRWLDSFGTDFIGLTGPREQVNQIQVALGLPGSVIEETEGGEYLVGHSSSVLAFTKDNVAHVGYPFGTRQDDWAHDLPKLVDERWGSR